MPRKFAFAICVAQMPQIGPFGVPGERSLVGPRVMVVRTRALLERVHRAGEPADVPIAGISLSSRTEIDLSRNLIFTPLG